MWLRVRAVVLCYLQSAGRKDEDNLYQIHSLFFSAEPIYLNILKPMPRMNLALYLLHCFLQVFPDFRHSLTRWWCSLLRMFLLSSFSWDSSELCKHFPWQLPKVYTNANLEWYFSTFFFILGLFFMEVI